MSPKARKKLGTLIDQADRTVAEMIRQRGGSASNVRQAGPWANKTMEETAEAAVNGDRTAEKAMKIAKHGKRLGELY
jgi:hypothetical protein